MKTTRKQNEYILKAIANASKNIPADYQSQYLKDEL